MVGAVASGGVAIGGARAWVCDAAGGEGGKAGARAACRAPALVRLSRLGCTNKARASLWLRRQAVMIFRDVQSGNEAGGAMAT